MCDLVPESLRPLEVESALPCATRVGHCKVTQNVPRYGML